MTATAKLAQENSPLPGGAFHCGWGVDAGSLVEYIKPMINVLNATREELLDLTLKYSGLFFDYRERLLGRTAKWNNEELDYWQAEMNSGSLGPGETDEQLQERIINATDRFIETVRGAIKDNLMLRDRFYLDVLARRCEDAEFPDLLVEIAAAKKQLEGMKDVDE